MNGEKFFKEMYHNIWQSHDITQFDHYYAKDFEEVITLSDEKMEPLELGMNYEELKKQAHLQKEKYRDTKIDIKKIVVSENQYISVCFNSSSVDRQSGDIRHRCVAGIWRINGDKKIDRVWAVVTPYHSHQSS